jgi:hypothetical protein
MIAPAHIRGGKLNIMSSTGAALVARRIRILILTLVLVSFGGIRVVTAQGVSDCTTFASFDEANAYFAAHPESASAIDDDQDGTACEVYFGLEHRDQTAREAEPPASAVLQLSQKEKGDLDCEDFQTQEEAQAVLLADSSDPNNLDPNGDGVACALLPLAADLQVNNASSPDAQTDESTNAGGKKKNKNNQPDEATQETTTTTTTVTCADYATPKQAQKAFDKDPQGLAALDPDGNGVVCEETTTTSEAAPTPEPTPEPGGKKKNKDNGNQPEPSANTTVDQPTVNPPEDIDCIDFQFQEEAQAVFNRDPSDPYNLDPNGDGFACSSLPSSMPITRVPNTGAGGRSTVQSQALVLATLLLTLAAGLVCWRCRIASDANTSKR